MSTATIIPGTRDPFAPTRERLRELSAPLTDAQLAEVVGTVDADETADVRNFDKWDVTNVFLLMNHLELTPADIFREYDGLKL